ncbi:Terminase large subunit gp17-like C-terminal domain-containing protein [uncultured Gammaproteobacteria bacterium]
MTPPPKKPGRPRSSHLLVEPEGGWYKPGFQKGHGQFARKPVDPDAPPKPPKVPKPKKEADAHLTQPPREQPQPHPGGQPEPSAENKPAAPVDASTILQALMRQRRIVSARSDLITFMELMRLDPEHPEDLDRSRYVAKDFHRAMAKELMAVADGTLNKLILNAPPRHGKSELSTRGLVAWYIGRFPHRSIIVGSYNEDMAMDFGRKVREFIRTPIYREIFPECTLAKGSQAADRLETEAGGFVAFVGRGGTITGRGADCLILDDPIKGRAEANSAAIRRDMWSWYTDDICTRFMTDAATQIITVTRWHHDDLIGRLTDSANEYYSEAEAKEWKVVLFKALSEKDDVLGRPIGEALWPDRFSREWLESQRRKLGKGFVSLYQQNPTPDDGELFRSDMMRRYRKDELPKNLRIYAASDHAVSTKQTADSTVIIVVGVDESETLWLLDCYWRRAAPDMAVDAMLRLMRKWKPILWWAEKGQISKSILPFLRVRMREEKIWINIQEQAALADKMTRAQSILGRMAMGKVRFPQGEPWVEDAISELLRFPAGAHDDFVDALAHIGLGLDQVSGPTAAQPSRIASKPGTYGWLKNLPGFKSETKAWIN